MAERVFMVHPELPGARISCAPSGVGMRQQAGWVLDETQDPQGPSDTAVAAARDVLVRAGWTVAPPGAAEPDTATPTRAPRKSASSKAEKE